MLYNIDLWLAIKGKDDTVHIEDLEADQWDSIEDFEIETEYDQLTDILIRVIEDCMNSDNGNIDKLSELVNEAQYWGKNDVMKIIAYNEEYRIDTIKELESIDNHRIEVLEGYEEPEDYLMEITSESCDIPDYLIHFIDWEGYAKSISFNSEYKQAEIDSEKFIYSLH